MRVRKPPKDQATKILDAASRLRLEQGCHAAQIEHIRAASGLSRGGFCHHVRPGSAVLQALVVRERPAGSEGGAQKINQGIVIPDGMLERIDLQGGLPLFDHLGAMVVLNPHVTHDIGFRDEAGALV